MFTRLKNAALGLAAAISMLAAVPVYAKGSSYIQAETMNASSAFIPKSAATGFMYTQRWAISTDGVLLICPYTAKFDESDRSCIANKTNQWISAERLAASYGRTYEGFQVVRHYQAVEVIVFWK